MRKKDARNSCRKKELEERKCTDNMSGMDGVLLTHPNPYLIQHLRIDVAID